MDAVWVAADDYGGGEVAGDGGGDGDSDHDGNDESPLAYLILVS